MPTETIVPTATSTNTPIPTPTLTPTPTEVPMPDFMNEFISLGYDKQSFEGDVIYVVFDEKSITYGPDNSQHGDYGLKYKDAVITSWTAAYYIKDGSLRKAYIITSYSVKSEIYTDLNPWWDGYFTIANSPKGYKIPMNIKFSRGILTQFFASDFLEGDYPILKGELNWQRFKTVNLGNREHFMASLYPPFSGKLELLHIPGIGDVIPVTNFAPCNIEGSIEGIFVCK